MPLFTLTQPLEVIAKLLRKLTAGRVGDFIANFFLAYILSGILNNLWL